MFINGHILRLAYIIFSRVNEGISNRLHNGAADRIISKTRKEAKMYQATIARVATVALAAAAFPAASASAAAHAENSASSHAGTPVAAADAVPILTAQEKNARVREAARNLHRKSAEHNSGAGSDNDTPASKAERRRRAAEESRKLSPESGTTERLSTEEVQRLVRRAKEADPDGKLPQHQWIRRMAWWDSFATFGDGIPSDYKPYDDGYANSGYEYDMWAQGYRMLGGFIDCDWRQGEGEPDGDGGGGDGQRQRRNAERDLSGDNTDDACGRWMMWAAVSQLSFVAGFALLFVCCLVSAAAWVLCLGRRYSCPTCFFSFSLSLHSFLTLHPTVPKPSSLHYPLHTNHSTSTPTTREADTTSTSAMMTATSVP